MNKKILIIISVIIMFIFSGCTPAVINDSSSSTNNTSINVNLFGVPNTFTKETSNEEKFDILKGGVNNLRIRPTILNEHSESSRELKNVVTTTNDVGQIFRASQDNINGIYLTVETGSQSIFEDFESYTTSTDLQNVWVDQLGWSLPILETNNVYEGDKSMKLDGGYLNGDWLRTIPSKDMEGNTLSFNAFFTQEYSKMKFQFYITDGTNTKYIYITHNAENTWQHFDIQESAMIEEQSSQTDTTHITGVGFRVVDTDWNDYMYVDNIDTTGSPGSVNIELWDMGTTIPTSDVTRLDDGVQYTNLGDVTEDTPMSQVNLNMVGGKRLYHVHKFVAGTAIEIPTNELLNVGNYYALVLKYVDTDINVYGATFNNDYYVSGYAFNTSNNGVIHKLGVNDDIMFSIFSTQDVYVVKSRASANSLPGNSANYMSSIEDYNMKTIEVITSHGVYTPQFSEVDLRDRPLFMPKGSKFNLDYNDDASDNVTQVTLGIQYLYEPHKIWG